VGQGRGEVLPRARRPWLRRWDSSSAARHAGGAPSASPVLGPRATAPRAMRAERHRSAPSSVLALALGQQQRRAPCGRSTIGRPPFLALVPPQRGPRAAQLMRYDHLASRGAIRPRPRRSIPKKVGVRLARGPAGRVSALSVVHLHREDALSTRLCRPGGATPPRLGPTRAAGPLGASPGDTGSDSRGGSFSDPRGGSTRPLGKLVSLRRDPHRE